jgi:hypothetical protein
LLSVINKNSRDGGSNTFALPVKR